MSNNRSRFLRLLDDAQRSLADTEQLIEKSAIDPQLQQQVREYAERLRGNVEHTTKLLNQPDER